MKQAEVMDLGLIKAIGHTFSDPTLLLTALTHKSVSDREKASAHGYNNERLEFLGDAVLSLVTANYLYHQNGSMNEGDLSRMRAQFVCQENLSLVAKNMGLGDFIMSDKAMRASGSNNSKSILADALEAVIGAIFIDGGLFAAEVAIFKMLGPPSTKPSAYPVDAKTKLQELVQATIHDAPRYVVLESKGPAHAPTFVVGVEIKGAIVASASGENKKVAAQNAASLALEKFALEPSGLNLEQ
jgi:ribonuclease III